MHDNGKTIHEYEVNYKAEGDEILRIENFLLSDSIKDAIRNPLGIDSYDKDSDVKSEDEYDFMGYPDIKVQDKKVVNPADKDGALEVLAFLDEEAYRGPFSNDLLLANSKRVLRKG